MLSLVDRIIWKGEAKSLFLKDNPFIKKKIDRDMYWAFKMYRRINKYKGEN
jgi:hypothetical protein